MVDAIEAIATPHTRIEPITARVGQSTYGARGAQAGDTWVAHPTSGQIKRWRVRLLGGVAARAAGTVAPVRR